jgi:hypothetical protein
MAKATKKQQKELDQQSQTLAGILGAKQTGFEEADSTAYALPMVRILQKGSPQVDDEDPSYIKGAKPGMIFHTIRGTVSKTIVVCPAFYRKVFLEWALRETGGGFRGEHSPAEARNAILPRCTTDDKNRLIMPNGNQISETANFYVSLEFEDGMWEPILISMASTQLKPSRYWMSQLRSQFIEHDGEIYSLANGLAMNAYKWELGTERHENDKGVWWVWTVKRLENTLMLPDLQAESDNIRTGVALNRLTYIPEQEAPAEDNSL